MIIYTVKLHGEIVGVYYHRADASSKAYMLEMQGHDANDIRIEMMGAVNDNVREAQAA